MDNKPWGWFPEIAIASAMGLLVVVASYIAGQNSQPWAMLVFWAGVLIIYLPAAARLWRKQVVRREAVALVALVGVLLFLVSLLRSPLHNTYYDEFLHWRTANSILRTQHLFSYNYLLPVSSVYPGLEIVTTAIVNLTGLGIFEAGACVIFSARLVMIIGLYLVLERLTGSVRAAGLGALIYMGSSTFVFFDSQFAYGSLSVPLLVLIVYLILRRTSAKPDMRFIWTSLTIFTIMMVVIVHHISAYILVGLLVVWTAAALFLRARGGRRFVPIRITAFTILWVLVWLLTIAQITITYLAPHVQQTILSALQMMMNMGGDRPVLISASSGLLSERLVGIASVGFMMLGLLLGWFYWWRRVPKENALALTLGLLALVYPALPILRLNSSTWEISNRLAGYIFFALSYIIGLGLAEAPLSGIWNHARRWLVLPGLGMILCGGIIAGSHPAARLPGPYMVEADSRSIDQQGIASAQWARAVLGPDNRMASDRVQSILMGAYGGQTLVFRYNDGINISQFFLLPQLGPEQIQDLQHARIRYLVIDRRITQSEPLYGYYFESWEDMVVTSFRPPVQIEMIEKFDRMAGVSRIYDSGDIRIYDVGALSHVP